MSATTPSGTGRLAGIALSLWLVASYLACNQVDDSFSQRYVGIDLREPAAAFPRQSEVGPSTVGLLRWSGRRPLTTRAVVIHAFDTIKLKLASDCDDVPVTVLLDDTPVATVNVTGSWQQFEVMPAAFGRSLTLDQRAGSPCAVHISRISITNVGGASTGRVKGYLRRDPLPYRSQPLAPASLALGAAPALAFLLLALASRKAARPHLGRAIAAVVPGLAALGVLEILRLLSPLRAVLPTSTFLIVTLAPPAAFALVRGHRGLVRLLVRLPGLLAARARGVVQRLSEMPVHRQLAPSSQAIETSGDIGSARSDTVRLRELGLPLLAGCLLVAVFFAALLESGLHIPLAPGDGWLQNVPARHLLAEELRAGRLPLWNPMIFAGFPLLGDIQVGALYPLHWIAAALPLTVAFNVALLASLVLGVCSTYGLARSFRMPPVAALFSGLVFVFSGFMLGNLGLTNMIEAAVWLPLALWMAHRFLTSGSWVHACLTAVALALQFLAGHPQTTAYTLITLGLYWLVDIVSSHGAVARARVAVGGLLVAGLLVTLVLPQLVATAELSFLSRRVSLTFQEFAGGSLRAAQLVKAAVPYFLSHVAPGATWSLHLGVVALTLAVLGWITRQRRDGAALWGGALVTGLLFAMAPGWPVIGRVLYHVPVLNAFRMPRRWLVLVTLAVAMLAGFALSRLLEAARSGGRSTIAPRLLASLGVMAALCTIAIVAQCGSPGARSDVWISLAHPRALMTWVAVGGLLVSTLAWIAPRARLPVVGAVFLLQAAELFSFNRHAEWRLVLDLPESFSSPGTASLEPASRRVLADLAGTRQRVFTLFGKVDWGLDDVNRSLDAFAPNVNLFLGAANVSGYSPLGFRHYLALSGINPYGGTVTPADAARWSGDHARLPDVLAAGWSVVPLTVRGTMTAAPPRARRQLPFADAMPSAALSFSDAHVPQSYLRPAAAAETLVFRPSTPMEVEALYLASASHEVPAGATVAFVEAREPGGRVHRIPIVVGTETADWKAGPRALTRGSVLLTGTADGATTFLYGVEFRPSRRVRLQELSLVPQPLPAGIWVPRALALKTAAGIVPLEANDLAGETSHDFVLKRRTTAMSRAWFAPAAEVVPLARIDAWLTGAPSVGDWDPAEVVLLPEGEALRPGPPPAPGNGGVTIERATPGRFILRSASEGRGYVVLSESWYPGWQVRIDDGGWLTPLKAYGLVQAVEVPAGAHRIEFSFRPSRIYWSFLGPILGLLALGSVVRLRRRRNAAANR